MIRDCLPMVGALLLSLVFGTTSQALPPASARPPAPPLTGGTDWLNTAKPLTLADLKGKVVVLDFWTLCCINCIHIMPDLAKLEQKYPNQLVVIGVHTPKFDNEKATESIRKAVLRYEIAHPVVNDSERKIWEAYEAQSWPTMAVIDTEGRLVGLTAGEGRYELLDRVITTLIAEGKAKGTLSEKPLELDPTRTRERAKSALYFPGKVLADAASNRLFISDSTHHRVIATDLTGAHVATVGTGVPGRVDGPAAVAQFDDPQGLALDGDTLYIADRKNHCIRAWDLKTESVRTVAGTGTQSQDSRGLSPAVAGPTVGLNSPWGLHRVGRTLYIAMAGHHQIWSLNLDTGLVGWWAGDGAENLRDGPLSTARFAQPSGLSADGEQLYVADSEVSAIRRVPLASGGRVETLVGKGLFVFGDTDGTGPEVRLQHALGIAATDGQVLIADTYNSKLKRLDPQSRTCTTVPLKPAAGEPEGPLLNEPAGLSVAGGKVYIADTNAHRIRVVDLATNTISTLKLSGVSPPLARK